VKTFLSSESWETAADFLEEAFSLVYDVDPLEEILVMKDEASNGYSLKMFVDGDLFCTVFFYDPEKTQVWSLFWQGTTRVNGISMKDFQQELHQVLESFGTPDQKLSVSF